MLDCIMPIPPRFIEVICSPGCLRLFAIKMASALALAQTPAVAPTHEANARPTMLGPFGVGSCYINNRSAEDNVRWLPKMEEIGLRFHRTPHFDWGALEPEEGKWAWGALDKQIDYLTEHHFAFGGLLIGNAKWNT